MESQRWTGVQFPPSPPSAVVARCVVKAAPSGGLRRAHARRSFPTARSSGIVTPLFWVRRIRGVLTAIAPIVGTVRVAAATGNIVKALAAEIELEDLEIALLEDDEDDTL